ncbi:ABC transporter permease [Parapedobacter pyrenivorans]|uniref:ABC transporter permease n=2 Tax=Parapedobacter pyrenivorans TaxID=1305674 RepID=A0A917HYN2_9SPHI|nr:ABC transporter permease [Parapedobacter pyrenivorans]
MIILETLLFFGSIYALKMLIDAVSITISKEQTEVEEIMYTLVWAALLTICYHVIKAFSVYATEIQSAKVSEHLYAKIHEKAAALDYSFYESPEYFDVLQRAKESGYDRPHAVVVTLFDTLKQVLGLFAIASVIFSIDALLLPLLVACMLPTLFIRIYYSDKLNLLRLRHTALERQSGYFGSLLTSENSAKEVRLFGLGDHFMSRLVDIRKAIVGERLAISYRRTIKEVMATVLATFGFFACIAYVVWGSIKGLVTIGDIAVFLVIFPQVFNMMQGVTNGITVVYHNNIFVKSIFDLFDVKGTEKRTVETEVTIESEAPISLELDNVSFIYPHAAKPTLSGINLSFPEGKVVAIVGLNGAGKSTLIKLICKLYEPTQGNISLGNVSINSFPDRQYRRYISAVFQDFCRYNVSVLENISLGDISKPTHELNKVKSAAQRAGAHEFIESLSDGYDTIMGRIFENGNEVSIGQWQKIAIARALYSSSKFLVLDEATSALDAKSEQKFFQELKENLNGRGALVISHRHSTVRHADYIYVLSNGKIIESGTYEQLQYAGGEFASLFKKEFVQEF